MAAISCLPVTVSNFVYRTTIREHIPKKHLDFENPIRGKMFDNTSDRVCGESRPEIMMSFNHQYGTGKNKAEQFPTMGKKTRNIEHEIAMKVAEEMREKERQAQALREQRFFETTSGSAYDAKDLTQNVVGRKVMRTQDGHVLQGVAYDIMQVESGMIKPPQKALDNELKARVPKGDYHVTRPVSIYTEALERKNIPISAATGPNPFARTSGFTQTANQTHSVANWEGNVDFSKEKSQVNFMRTSGTNLSQSNPYMQKPVAIRNFEDIRREALRVCNERSNNGLRGLRVFFKRMDRDGSGSIDPIEFKYAMREFGLELSEVEVTEIVKHFDTNKDGMISFDEMIRMLRGSLNDRRLRAVNAVFSRLDRLNRGSLELQALERAYHAHNHPAVKSGATSADGIATEFSNAWSTQKKSGLISREEFVDYYTEAGAHIASDDEFEAMLRAVWN